MNVILDIRNAVLEVITSFFRSDMDIVSPEAKEIMSNPADRKKYVDAVEKLKSGDQEKITIDLSTGPITLS